MNKEQTPDPHQTPYHPFDEPTQYRAFEEGWAARKAGEAISSVPYSLARADQALAWMDGWRAAEEDGIPSVSGTA